MTPKMGQSSPKSPAVLIGIFGAIQELSGYLGRPTFNNILKTLKMKSLVQNLGRGTFLEGNILLCVFKYIFHSSSGSSVVGFLKEKQFFH